MMLYQFSISILAWGAILGNVGNAQPYPLDSFTNTKRATSPSDATAFAIIYGYPLTQYAASLDSVITSVGTNAILSEKHTATANEAAIVRPNVDTLYSKIAVDLSSHQVVITIPKIDDRFYVFPFYDLWSNNFANLGSLNNTAPGKYLLRYTPGRSGFESSPKETGYLGIVSFPTPYGLVLPRILLKNNSTDLDIVHAIQDQIKVEKVRQPFSVAPPLSYELLGNGALEPLALISPAALDTNSVKTLLTVVARVAPYNFPAATENIPVTSVLRVAGLINGQYSPPRYVNYTEANKIVNTALTSTDTLIQLFNNEWFDYPPEASGNFHSFYTVRSIIAYTGYLQLVQEEALYPEYLGSGIKGLSLTGNESYTLTFSGKPPVKGFWSLTAYNSSSYLIPNPLNRYSLGDRSSLTYDDGQLVYGTDRNGSFTILIQPADVTPPANWTNNWLPAPVGGGNFTVNLRFYGPTKPLYAGGTYTYPVVKKQAVIVPQ
ncbi:hypothetical protein GGI35DRAFT_460096 [Trichoderma velutinum]